MLNGKWQKCKDISDCEFPDKLNKLNQLNQPNKPDKLNKQDRSEWLLTSDKWL